MDVVEVGPGLWRWTTEHPDWTPEEGWERRVGSVYWESDRAVVLIDPLIPVERAERQRLLVPLDRDVERAGLPISVLLTCAWHRRSAAEIVERYGASLLEPDIGDEHVEGATRFAPGSPLPGEALAVAATPAFDEVVYWLPGVRAVVPGDTIVGGDDGRGVSLCPASWLRPGTTPADLAAALRPLLDLGVDHVLVSHGEPARAEGGSALERALADV
jgi:hypothetical protein